MKKVFLLIALCFCILANAQKKECLAYMLSQIEKAELHCKPFLHLEIDNIFPDDFYDQLYDQLLEYFPQASSTNYKRHRVYKNRYQVCFKQKNHTKQLEKKIQPFFQDLYAILMSKKLKHALYKKLAPAVIARFGSMDKALQMPIFSEMRLVLEEIHYAIEPHCDHFKKCMTVLFYCPSNSAFKEHGLHLGQMTDNTFITKKKIEYIPNKLIAFIPHSNITWHTVPEILENFERKSIQLFYVQR